MAFERTSLAHLQIKNKSVPDKNGDKLAILAALQKIVGQISIRAKVMKLQQDPPLDRRLDAQLEWFLNQFRWISRAAEQALLKCHR